MSKMHDFKSFKLNPETIFITITCWYFFYNSRIYKAAVLTKTKTHTCEIKLLTEDKKSSLSYEI